MTVGTDHHRLATHDEIMMRPLNDCQRTHARRVVALSALTLGGALGVVAARTTAVSLAVGTAQAVLGGMTIGFMIGRSWKYHRLPSQHTARTVACASAGLLGAVFVSGVYRIPSVDDSWVVIGHQGQLLFAVILTAFVVAVADQLVKQELPDPFCEACGNWSRTVSSGCGSRPAEESPHFGRTLKEHLVIHDLRDLDKLRPGIFDNWFYRVRVSSCACEAVQSLNVTEVMRSSEGDFTSKIVRSLPLTLEEAQTIKALCPIQRDDPPLTVFDSVWLWGRLFVWMSFLLMLMYVIVRSQASGE